MLVYAERVTIIRNQSQLALLHSKNFFGRHQLPVFNEVVNVRPALGSHSTFAHQLKFFLAPSTSETIHILAPELEVSAILIFAVPSRKLLNSLDILLLIFDLRTGKVWKTDCWMV